MSSHIMIQNPSDMSSKFSNQDKLGWGSNPYEDIDSMIEQELEVDEGPEIDRKALFDKEKLDTIRKYLEEIPDREADLISLYYEQKMKQEQIARLFGITQAAVSYRLARGLKRIRFLMTIPELDKEEFELDLGPKFIEQDLEILWRMYKTTCQSEIAKQMGLTQGRVRHRFFRALNRIKELIAEEVKEKQAYAHMLVKQGKNQELIDEAEADLKGCIENNKYSKYWKVYFSISDKHFVIRHEVIFPQFKNRGDAQIMPIG